MNIRQHVQAIKLKVEASPTGIYQKELSHLSEWQRGEIVDAVSLTHYAVLIGTLLFCNGN